MTITTAKRRQLPAALLATLLAPAAQAADWTFVPSVALKETYTDNLTLTSADQARSQFITEVMPAFSLEAKGRNLTLRSRYQLSYYSFKDDELSGTNRSQHQFAGDARARLIDDLLYLDATGSIGDRAVSLFGPQVNDNGYIAANRAKVKSYSISPYLIHQFDNFATAQLRYTSDYVESGNAGLGTTESDNVVLSLSSGTGFRRFGWGFNHSQQQLDDSAARSSTTELTSLSLRYGLNSRFALTTSFGYDKYDYQALGGVTKGKSWNAGFDWTPGLRTSLKASAGKRYFGSSYSLNAVHRSRRTSWSINYNDAVTTTRSQFLLPVTISTADMLDRLFAANIADPDERARAVAEYIAATGLPPSLADSVNYFSNRFQLQKQFQASVAMRGAHTSLVLSTFSTRREALSVQESDNPLLGPGSSINDNTSQLGISALANWRISPRSSLSLSASKTRTESNTTGQNGDNQIVRLSLTRQFQRKLSGALEVRQVDGLRGIASGTYRERALTASLSLKL